MVSVLMVAGTVYLSMGAFDDWEQNPISTVTEVKTIYEVKFPKIVVCPPKVSFSLTLVLLLQTDLGSALEHFS